MWVSGDVTSERKEHVNKELELCLKRIRRIDDHIIAAKIMEEKLVMWKYVKMLKSATEHYEELKRMKYYLSA